MPGRPRGRPADLPADLSARRPDRPLRLSRRLRGDVVCRPACRRRSRARDRVARDRSQPHPGAGPRPPAPAEPRPGAARCRLLVRRGIARRGGRDGAGPDIGAVSHYWAMPTWEDVEAIGLRYPGVERTTWFGTPSLKVAGKGMCRLRTDPDALV